jgi:hypothetical protein
MRSKVFQHAVVVGLLLSAQPAFADDQNAASGDSSPGLIRSSVAVIRNFVEKIARPFSLFHTVSQIDYEERLSHGVFSIDQFQPYNDPTQDAFLMLVSERRIEMPMSRHAKMAWELRRYTTAHDNGTEIGVTWSINFKF